MEMSRRRWLAVALLLVVAALALINPVNDATVMPQQEAASPGVSPADAARPDPSLAGRRRAGDVFQDCDECPELVVVPAGEFLMGSPSSEEGSDDDKGPQHSVSVGRFALGRHEVTRGKYAAFVRSTGRAFVRWTGGSDRGCWGYDDSGSFDVHADATWRSPGFRQTDDEPVVCVSWTDARAYVWWLSDRTGESYRLPSESEWEYAARGETRTSRYWGSSSSGQCEHANGADGAAKRRFDGWTVAGCDDGHEFTAPVGSFRANDFGLFDVLGNVWEWVADCYHDDYRGAPADGSLWTGSSRCRRVLRGGSWDGHPRHLRSANRNRNDAVIRDNHAGFRVARTLD